MIQVKNELHGVGTNIITSLECLKTKKIDFHYRGGKMINMIKIIKTLWQKHSNKNKKESENQIIVYNSNTKEEEVYAVKIYNADTKREEKCVIKKNL